MSKTGHRLWRELTSESSSLIPFSLNSLTCKMGKPQSPRRTVKVTRRALDKERLTADSCLFTFQQPASPGVGQAPLSRLRPNHRPPRVLRTPPARPLGLGSAYGRRSFLARLLWNCGLVGPETNPKRLSTLPSAEHRASDVPDQGLRVPAD